ncbi:MAG: OprD family outer membrane porin [Pseudomonadota bacterium]|nr:OprD family outer membrane porin [Pseudomonadota bacterium]
MKTNKTIHKILGIAVLMAMASTVAQAEDLSQFIAASKIDGQIRSYYFNREYGAPSLSTQKAFSVAGLLNLQTAPFWGGYGVGASFYTASGLGLNNMNSANLDSTLMGSRQSINALGQMYLQYEMPKKFLIRGGDQIINTPWMNSSDSRVLPATYEGFYAQGTPVTNWNIYGARIYRWKSRTSSNYFRDNLYYPATYNGDTMYGGGSAPNNSLFPQTNGALALGTSYALMGAKAQLWYYNYYQFTKMYYGDLNYTFKTVSGLDPFIGAQYVREKDGNSLLGNVDASAHGLIGGVNYVNRYGKGNASLAYNAINAQGNNVYGHGAIVSPYTVSYATDPLYTTSMIRGLVELGPGHAWKVKLTQNFLNSRVLVMAAFARYNTYYNGSSNDTYLDVTYNFQGRFKGLSLRDREEVAAGGSPTFNNGAGGNTGHYFSYNRVMLTYAF